MTPEEIRHSHRDCNRSDVCLGIGVCTNPPPKLLTCAHFHFDVKEHYPAGKAFCSDCCKFVDLAEAFSNLAEEMRETILAMRRQRDQLKS